MPLRLSKWQQGCEQRRRIAQKSHPTNRGLALVREPEQVLGPMPAEPKVAILLLCSLRVYYAPHGKSVAIGFRVVGTWSVVGRQISRIIKCTFPWLTGPFEGKVFQDIGAVRVTNVAPCLKV